MAQELEIQTQIMDNQVIVELKGSIDEDSDFSKIQSLEGDTYVFDFNQIEMINSCGVREWISFIEGLPENAHIIYKSCPQVVIEQINMVQGFIRKGARIDSFYAPYYSEQKDEVKSILLKASDIKDGKAPEVKDPETGEELEFDAIEAQYFNFLKQNN